METPIIEEAEMPTIEEAGPIGAEPMAVRVKVVEVLVILTYPRMMLVDYIGSSGREPGRVLTDTSVPGGTWRAPGRAMTETSTLLK